MSAEPVAGGRVLFGESELVEMISRWAGPSRVPRRVRVINDTSDFFRVDYDDVVILDSHPYFIRNYECEGRFGIDEQPKFWVRRALDLFDGSTKIIKMVFHEQFTAHVGDLTFECARSPRKRPPSSIWSGAIRTLRRVSG